MRVGLDTSVVLRLLTDSPEGQAQMAWQAIVEVHEGGWQAAVSDMVISEAYFALQHHYGVPKDEALAQLRKMLESGYVASTGCAAQVLSVPGLATANPGFVDRMIHAAYLSIVDQMLSFERAARKLPRTRVLGP